MYLNPQSGCQVYCFPIFWLHRTNSVRLNHLTILSSHKSIASGPLNTWSQGTWKLVFKSNHDISTENGWKWKWSNGCWKKVKLCARSLKIAHHFIFFPRSHLIQYQIERLPSQLPPSSSTSSFSPVTILKVIKKIIFKSFSEKSTPKMLIVLCIKLCS